MISNMREKFDKYWEEYSVVLAMGAVLDPRMKLKLLKRFYGELDPFTSQEKVDHLEDQLRKFFDDDRRQLSLTHVVSLQDHILVVLSKEQRPRTLVCWI